MVLARLKDGVTPAQAQADMKTVAAAAWYRVPAFDTGWTANVVPLMEQVVGSSRSVLALVAGAIALVLLIACANVASLTIARAWAAAASSPSGPRSAQRRADWSASSPSKASCSRSSAAVSIGLGYLTVAACAVRPSVKFPGWATSTSTGACSGSHCWSPPAPDCSVDCCRDSACAAARAART
jgi:hypothetical protein